MCKSETPLLSPSRPDGHRAGGSAAATIPAGSLMPAKGLDSSGVKFYPPSEKYWRIGGKWYDFSNFLAKHPGGATVMRLAKVRAKRAVAGGGGFGGRAAARGNGGGGPLMRRCFCATGPVRGLHVRLRGAPPQLPESALHHQEI